MTPPAAGHEQSRQTQQGQAARGRDHLRPRDRDVLAGDDLIRCGLLPVLPDDLAYPELLPPEERGRFLYSREAGLAPALGRAIDAFRERDWWEAREELVTHTDRYEWVTLAPQYDQVFEEALG